MPALHAIPWLPRSKAVGPRPTAEDPGPWPSCSPPLLATPRKERIRSDQTAATTDAANRETQGFTAGKRCTEHGQPKVPTRTHARAITPVTDLGGYGSRNPARPRSRGVVPCCPCVLDPRRPWGRRGGGRPPGTASPRPTRTVAARHPCSPGRPPRRLASPAPRPRPGVAAPVCPPGPWPMQACRVGGGVGPGGGKRFMTRRVRQAPPHSTGAELFCCPALLPGTHALGSQRVYLVHTALQLQLGGVVEHGNVAQQGAPLFHHPAMLRREGPVLPLQLFQLPFQRAGPCPLLLHGTAGGLAPQGPLAPLQPRRFPSQATCATRMQAAKPPLSPGSAAWKPAPPRCGCQARPAGRRRCPRHRPGPDHPRAPPAALGSACRGKPAPQQPRTRHPRQWHPPSLEFMRTRRRGLRGEGWIGMPTQSSSDRHCSTWIDHACEIAIQNPSSMPSCPTKHMFS